MPALPLALWPIQGFPAEFPGLPRRHKRVWKSRGENRLHRTLDVQFREDNCRRRMGNATVVMGVLNMMRKMQRNFSPEVFTGMWRDRTGHRL